MKNLKKYNSNIFKGIVKGFVLGLIASNVTIIGSNAFNSFRYESELLNEKKEKERKEKEALNQEFESLLSTSDLEISEEASEAINKISLAPLNMTYLEDFDITKESVSLAYQDSSEFINHINTRLYEEESNSIDWDEAASIIYQNGISIEDLDDSIEPLSFDEVKEQVEWIEEFYSEVKSDFKDYDTKELACLLEDYSFLKTSTEKGNIVAETTLDNITFYPLYYQEPRILKEATTKHEAVHLLVNPCIDVSIKDMSGGIDVLNLNGDGNYIDLSSYIFKFIEEIYAELYSKEKTIGIQLSYNNYDEALNYLQAVLALGDTYQVDLLLQNLLYKDARGFVQELPSFGPNKEKLLLDTLKSIKALDLFVNPDLNYLSYLKDKYPDISYEKMLMEIKDYFISGLGKLYYNNLILLNEKYNLTLEDNTALTILYWKLINNVKEGNMYLVDEEETNDYLLYPNKDLSYLLREYPLLKANYSNLDIHDYHDIFVEYLSKKYNMDKNDVYDATKDTSILKKDYQMPKVLGEEKQEFYQWLWEDKSDEIDLFNSRELVKEKTR